MSVPALTVLERQPYLVCSFVLYIRTCCLFFWVTQKLFYFWGTNAFWVNPVRYWFSFMRPLQFPFATIFEVVQNHNRIALKGRTANFVICFKWLKNCWEVPKIWQLHIWMSMYLVVRSRVYCGYKWILFLHRCADIRGEMEGWGNNLPSLEVI